jgi:hypothetical protein
MHLQDHIQDLAKELAGNWQQIVNDPMTGFVYHDPPWEPEDEETDGVKWCLVYTSTRDSGLMAQSNEAVMERDLKEFFGADSIRRVRHSHWGPGYLDGFEIRVFDKDGNITPGFAKYAELKLALADYPVLDDSDYSEREYNATINNIWRAGFQFVRSDVDKTDESWSRQVYEWLRDNNEEALENVDDQGAWPSDEQIIEALRALKIISKSYEDVQ